MAQGTIAPVARQQFCDANGNPYAGGKLRAFVAGTTTPVAFYTDSALLIPHAIPAILDGAGRISFFLSPGSYKVTLHDSSDVLIWTQDNIASVAPFNVDVEIEGRAGTTLLANDAVYLATDGLFYKADSDLTYASSLAGIVGIVPAAIGIGLTGAVRLQGRVTGFAGLSIGSAYYAGPTAGIMTASAPANLRFMGVADTETSLVLSPLNDPLLFVVRTNVNNTFTMSQIFSVAGGPQLTLRRSGLADSTSGAATWASLNAHDTIGVGLADITFQRSGTSANLKSAIYFHTGGAITALALLENQTAVFAGQAQFLGGTIAPLITGATGGTFLSFVGTGAGATTWQQYLNTNSDLVLFNVADRLKLGATGLLTIPAGQIAFPAAQNASADINTLDDYEEGAWTPVIGGFGGTSGQTYAAQVGSYTKIGKLVHAQCYVVLTAKGTITGSVQIQGLPFTAENTANLNPSASFGFWRTATNQVAVVGSMTYNSTAIDIYTMAAAAAQPTGIVAADIADNSVFQASIVYRATA